MDSKNTLTSHTRSVSCTRLHRQKDNEVYSQRKWPVELRSSEIRAGGITAASSDDVGNRASRLVLVIDGRDPGSWM